MKQKGSVFVKRWTSISLGINVLAAAINAAIVHRMYEILIVGGAGALALVLRCFLKISRDQTIKDFSMTSAFIMVIAAIALSITMAVGALLEISATSAIIVLVLTLTEFVLGLTLYCSKYKIPKKVKKGK
ncbi:MAG: hypothetical protein IKW66_01635 [Clostridia bacterium]|jgi:hypothetical protein|nr:hypothetical protein [Clostridia bacterium]